MVARIDGDCLAYFFKRIDLLLNVPKRANKLSIRIMTNAVILVELEKIADVICATCDSEFII
jgi:hypothetical protein